MVAEVKTMEFEELARIVSGSAQQEGMRGAGEID
jgi:hypothetical protein